MSNPQPSYLSVFLTFARNSLIRDMTFRSNFVLQCITSVSWTLMNIGFYLIVFTHAEFIGRGTGWGQYEFFVFLATTWFVTSLVQAFFMPNAQEFSELIRTGNLDFALLKPIDTQFLISFQKVEWSSLANFAMAVVLLVISLMQLTDPESATNIKRREEAGKREVAAAEKSSTDKESVEADNSTGFLTTPGATMREGPLVLNPAMLLLYPLYILCGVAIMYSLMITLASTSIWLGRNQTLYNFWFYITNFSRYPMEIYSRGWGAPLWGFFTFIVPVLLVVNIPARLLAQPLTPRAWWEWPLAGFAIVATVFSLIASRFIFRLALGSYRSASS